MQRVRGWEAMRELSGRLLKERTGEDVDAWSRRIRRERFANKEALRTWLDERGVAGYARSLLEWECFGYPEFLTTSGEKLIDAQYADRPQLRPIFEAIIAAAASVGDVVVQARKTYVSLVSPRRTFARVEASTRSSVSLGLRLSGRKPGGRLRPSRIHETMPLEIRLESANEVDAEVIDWLQQAFVENA